MRKANQGDDTARSHLYRLYAGKMMSICVRMTGTRNDAEDVLQESFIIAFNNLHQLKEAGLFEPWLRKIVVNECIKYTRRKVRWHDMEDNIADLPEESDSGWLEVLSFEQIHGEIRNLPDGCREVFNLYVLEDYSHQQIADLLKVSESTSKSQYHRARKLLKERLTKQLIHHG
ncbi:MAG: sigma-70 family RNA polymerase sigma factor [Chitinophagaceae bacterium]